MFFIRLNFSGFLNEVFETKFRWISTVRKLRDEDPRLIAAYIYHMYLGLYSGGKILRHKFKLPGQTLDLDERSNNIKSSLKTAMKNLVLSDAALAQKLIEHSENLFKLNNLIIKECEIQKTRLFKIFGIIAFSIAGICIYRSVSNWFYCSSFLEITSYMSNSII